MSMNKRQGLLVLLVLMLITACAMLALSPRPPLYGDIPISTAWYDREGRLLRFDLASDERFRLTTRLHEMPTDLVRATLLQEDRFFLQPPRCQSLLLAPRGIRNLYSSYASSWRIDHYDAACAPARQFENTQHSRQVETNLEGAGA